MKQFKDMTNNELKKFITTTFYEFLKSEYPTETAMIDTSSDWCEFRGTFYVEGGEEYNGVEYRLKTIFEDEYHYINIDWDEDILYFESDTDDELNVGIYSFEFNS